MYILFLFVTDLLSLSKDDHRPLTNEELDPIKKNYTFLVGILKVLDVLQASDFENVLSPLQVIWIESFTGTPHNVVEQRRKFIEMMRRRSFIHYQRFLASLNSTNQSNVVSVLQSPGGTFFSYLL